MNVDRTLELISALADGTDPLTGQVLDADHLCQQPEIIRALHAAREIVAREARRERRLTQARLTLPGNTGRNWSEDEDRLLDSRFRSGSSIADMATLHARTPGGIRARLFRLGLVDKSGVPQLATRTPGANVTPLPRNSYLAQDRDDVARSRPAGPTARGPTG
jgi:hypothetical protein